jgi:hypothetical protein
LARLLILAKLLSGYYKMTYPILNVYPSEVMIDEPVQIWIEGAEPGQKFSIEAESDRFWSLPSTWRSRAVFQADESGRVDVSCDAPLEGTYSGVNAQGLFTSMQLVYMPRPYKQKQIADVPRLHLEKITIRVKDSADAVVAQTEIKRFALAENVHARNVCSGDVVGRYFYSSDMTEPRPAIITLGGNKEQMEDAQGYAALFAGMGMPALALAYYRLEHLSASINQVPVEIIEKAIEWLGCQDQVDSRLIGIFGCSRGAELALVSASLISRLRFVIAVSPSAYVFEGLDANGIKTGRSSWTYRGKDMAFVPATESKIRMAARRIYGRVSKDTPQTLPLFDRALSNQNAREQARIKVENINGPVLLISGQSDKYWPSSCFAKEIEHRLKKSSHAYPVQWFDYPAAGHKIRVPYLPAFRTNGGTPAGNAVAGKESWQHMRGFLRSILDISEQVERKQVAR